MKYAFVFVLAIIIFSACVHKPANIEVTPTTPTGCDSLKITYTTNIKPIFATHCYSCHGTLTNNGGLDLEDSTSLKKYLIYDFRGDGIYGSKLFHCIIHSTKAPDMPPTYLIDSCSILKIKYWLIAGGTI